MSTRLYPLRGGDGDETKVWYPLNLEMKMGLNFFYGDVYGITKPVPTPLSSLMLMSFSKWLVSYTIY